MLQIDDEHLPLIPAWEGRLENEESLTRGAALSPQVTIGKASWWQDKSFVDTDWQLPIGMTSFGLARFVFSIGALERQQVKQASLQVTFFAPGAPINPTVFDMLPGTTTVERDHSGVFTLGPGLRFTDAMNASSEFTVGKIELIIKRRQAVPALITHGVGTASVNWTFMGIDEKPLLGGLSTYALVDLPTNYSALYARIELEVIYADGLLGFLGSARLPGKAADRLTQRLL